MDISAVFIFFDKSTNLRIGFLHTKSTFFSSFTPKDVRKKLALCHIEDVNRIELFLETRKIHT